MASPTEAEVKTEMANAIDLLDETRKFAGVNSPNWIGLEDALIQSLETDYGSDVLAAVDSARASLAGVFFNGASLLTPFLLEYAKIIDAPETDALSILGRLYDDYAANSKRVTSRQFTFGSAVAGTNEGNGTINRLNTDAKGFSIENQYADTKTAVCIRDAFSGGQEHAEVFQIRGTESSKDGLKLSGSGGVAEITALSASDSLSFLSNPSFDEFTGAMNSPAAITGWDTGVIANFELDGTSFYRGAPGVEVPVSLVIKADDFITQDFADTTFDVTVPYYGQVAYNDEIGGASSGTITLTFGDQTAVGTLTNSGGWKILRIALGVKNWYDTFGATSPVFKVAVAGITAGMSVRVDDLIVAPFAEFDHSWYAIVGGSTPFRVEDEFVFTDSEVGAVIQYWIWRLFDRYLPSAVGGSVTWVDP